MGKIIMAVFLCVFGLSLLAVEPNQYVGSKKCMICHKGASKHMVWEKWLESSHSKAMKSLDSAKGEDKKAECLSCHTTGFKKGGYEPGAPNASDFEGVGCETCHGPGSGYRTISIMKDKSKAMANGLLIPNEETCRQCHNSKSPNFKGFTFQEYLKKIDHRYK